MVSRAPRIVAIIGSALLAAATGSGHRAIADAAGLPPGTVRGWLRRAWQRRASHATLAGWVDSLGWTPTRPGFIQTTLSRLLELIADVHRAAHARFNTVDR